MNPGIERWVRSNWKRMLPRVARVVTAVFGAFIIASSKGSAAGSKSFAGALVLYVVVRIFLRKHRKTMCIVDAVMASIGIALTGSMPSPMLAFGIAVAVAGGLYGIGLGAICGSLVIAASVPSLAHQAGAGFAQVNRIVTWAALFPISGIAAGLAKRVWSGANKPQAQAERTRIARDLHDGVAQTLAHLRMELDMLAHLQMERDPQELARLARVAERTLTDVRGIIRDLAAPAPDGGIARALAVYVGDVSSAHGPEITLQVIGEVPADHPAGTHLFRIAQEAISNAVRHSGGSRVEVLLERCSGGALRLRISDNGCGAADPHTNGLGLETMRERAASLGADYAFASEPGKGTVVEVLTSPPLMRIA